MVAKYLILYLTIFWISSFESSPLALAITSPAPSSSYTHNMTCDFEPETPCEWDKKNSKWLRWTISNGTQFGGVSDHTTGTEEGHFLTTVGSNHVASTAEILGPLFHHGPHCVEFYAKTDHKDSSNIIVYKMVENLKIPMYKSKGKMFPHWQKIQLTIISPQPYKIGIETQQTTGQIGQVFLDDVTVTAGKCPLQPLSTTNVTCDFEDNQRMCGFTSGTKPEDGHQEWMLYDRSLRLPRGMAKISDHTLDTTYGHCLISQLYSENTNSSGHQHPAVATSPLYKGVGTHCLSFHYLMFTEDDVKETNSIGELGVYISPEDPEIEAHLIHSLWTSGKRRKWIHVYVQFDINMEYRLGLYSKNVHPQYKTVYGIDDFTVRSTECPKSTSPSSTPTTTTTTPTATTRTTTTSSPPTTPTTISTTATTTDFARATVQIGKQTDDKTDRTWVYGLAAGGGLLVLIAIVVFFVSRHRRRSLREKPSDYKGGISQEFQDQEYAQPSRHFKTVAYSNPITDEDPVFTTCINPMFPVMEKQGEAKA